jgi:hypothetical protein
MDDGEAAHVDDLEEIHDERSASDDEKSDDAYMEGNEQEETEVKEAAPKSPPTKPKN